MKAHEDREANLDWLDESGWIGEAIVDLEVEALEKELATERCIFCGLDKPVVEMELVTDDLFRCLGCKRDIEGRR